MLYPKTGGEQFNKSRTTCNKIKKGVGIIFLMTLPPLSPTINRCRYGREKVANWFEIK